MSSNSAPNDVNHPSTLDELLGRVRAWNPRDENFLQAYEEVAHDLFPIVDADERYRRARILERLAFPDRILEFRVCWMDDAGNVQINRGWRVQYCNAIGPYKGGLRFHPEVHLDDFKFLGLEQVFKNSLTGLPMGGAKGGADFDPKGRSDAEVLRFCRAFMTELVHHIGRHTDVPAGDIGVGAREIGYLFGQYKRIQREFTGVLTGKGLSFGGSAGRAEATGHGCAYFLQSMVEHGGGSLEGKRAVVSGSGNVALYLIEKLGDLGVQVVTASDSDGFVHDPAGISGERFRWLRELKEVRRGRIREYAEQFGCEYHEGERPWGVEAELAVPCATQNEVDEDDARRLVELGVEALAEGSNMPLTGAAARVIRDAEVLHAPGKASNAGGVAVSGLERTQNATAQQWSAAEVDERLQEIMRRIHDTCVEEGTGHDGVVDYRRGANIGGFRKVADAMVATGPV